MDRIRKAGSRITRVVAITLVVVGLSFNVFLIYQRLFNSFEVVQGSSMAPTIKSGEAILMKDVDAKNIVVGQIIVFRDWEAKDTFVVHRVVKIEDDGYTRLFTTKGDNNPVVDPAKTPSGGVVGAVLVHVPVVGSLLQHLSTIRGFASGVVVPILGGLLLAGMQDAADTKQRNRCLRAAGACSAATG